LPIIVPPLRERADDVLPLAKYFISRSAGAAGRPAPSLTRDAAAALRDYAWPGNVRELSHVVDRAFQTAPNNTITLADLPNEILQAPAPEPQNVLSRRPSLGEVERRYIAATLRHARGNQTMAARLLGISRKALWEKRKRYGLD